MSSFSVNHTFLAPMHENCEKLVFLKGNIAGTIITACAFAYARKSVKQIILRRGGKSVYIETFGLFGLGKKHNVELQQLDCTISRIASKGYVPLKRVDRGYFTDYLVDNTGHYPDPFLFDLTAGMQRTFKGQQN